MRASRKWVVLGIAVGLLALWRPAGAAATPIDTASDHAALVAYHDYVEGLLSSLPSARTAMSDYVSKISARCPDVLAPIAGLPAGSLNRAATLAVIEELGGDVGAAAHPALRAPLRRMAATLAGLRWSSGQTGQTITSFVAAQRRLYGLGPSHRPQSPVHGPPCVRRFDRANDATGDAPLAGQGRSRRVRPGQPGRRVRRRLGAILAPVRRRPARRHKPCVRPSHRRVQGDPRSRGESAPRRARIADRLGRHRLDQLPEQRVERRQRIVGEPGVHLG